MSDWISCYRNWVPLSDEILYGTPYLLKNNFKAFIHFPTSQEGPNSKYNALEEGQVKIKIQALYRFWEL